MITREIVLELSEALDPQHQGICWPDPIAWDGRPVREQMEDLLVLADADIDQTYEVEPYSTQLQRVVDARDTAVEAIA